MRGCLRQDPLLRAQERARYLSDYKALLQHEDSSMRMAAVEEALASNDTQLRSMALETALASDDQRLQTEALRWYVDNRSQILVTFVMPERPSKAQQHIFSKWDGLILKDPEVAPNGSEIKFTQYYSAGGQLIRGGLEFRFLGTHHQMGICAMTVRPTGGTLLTGQFYCTFSGYEELAGGADAALPVRIDLS